MKKYRLKDGVSFEEFVEATGMVGLDNLIQRHDYDIFKNSEYIEADVYGQLTPNPYSDSDPTSGYIYNSPSPCFEEYIDESVKPKATGDYIGDHFDGDALPPVNEGTSVEEIVHKLSPTKSTLCTEGRLIENAKVTLIANEVTWPHYLKIMEEEVPTYDTLPPSPVHKSTKRVENGIITDERSTLCTEARGQVHTIVTLIDAEVTCPHCLKIMEEGVRVEEIVHKSFRTNELFAPYKSYFAILCTKHSTKQCRDSFTGLEARVTCPKCLKIMEEEAKIKSSKMQEGKEAYQKLTTAKEPELPSSYHKKVWSTYSKCYVYIDVYDMVDALDLPNFATIQTFKKIWDGGNRSGGKSLLQDLKEARTQLDMAIDRVERKEGERLYEEKHNG